MTLFQAAFESYNPSFWWEISRARHIPVVKTFPSARMIMLFGDINAPLSSPGLSPQIDSVTVIDATHIRVTFLYPATNNVSLLSPDNYLITPTLAVSLVVPEAITNPTYVNLTIQEQTDGVPYQIELQRIVKA